jgi:hypothetical protein
MAPPGSHRGAIARHLARRQPLHAEIVRDPEKYHQVEERDIDVAPAAKRARSTQLPGFSSSTPSIAQRDSRSQTCWNGGSDGSQ